MKKSVAVCLSLILSFLILAPGKNVHSQASDQSSRNYVEDEILVKLKDSVEAGDEQEIPELVLNARGTSVRRLTGRSRGNVNLVRLNGQLSVEQAVRQARQDPRVEFAEPNYLLKATNTVPDDQFFSQMWGMSNAFSQSQPPADISATRAWDITTGSDDLVVAVIDTGIDLSHADLEANAWVNPREIPNNGVDDDGNGYIDDKNGWNFFNDNKNVFQSESEDMHGTHVAGTIGAVGNNRIGVAGVAWHVKLMSLKFLGGSKGEGSTGDAVRALSYAIDQKNRGVNVRVVNASWGGGGQSQSLRNAIAAAGAAGIVFVCAAGNEAADNDSTADFPANFATDLNNVISVASITRDDELSSFSSFGHLSVSVAAPGTGIISTLPNNHYGSFSGTSMASPHVAGIAALVLSNEPSLTPAQVRDRIVSTAEPASAVASKMVSSGRASAYNALTNTIPPASKPVIARVEIKKKRVTIDGLGFLNGSSVVEVNGVVMPGMVYDGSYAVANGTLTRLRAEPGKKIIKGLFPLGVSVEVNVFNPTTGEQSASFRAARF